VSYIPPYEISTCGEGFIASEVSTRGIFGKKFPEKFFFGFSFGFPSSESSGLELKSEFKFHEN
jgi:hypothetical protein